MSSSLARLLCRLAHLVVAAARPFAPAFAAVFAAELRAAADRIDARA